MRNTSKLTRRTALRLGLAVMGAALVLLPRPARSQVATLIPQDPAVETYLYQDSEGGGTLRMKPLNRPLTFAESNLLLIPPPPPGGGSGTTPPAMPRVQAVQVQLEQDGTTYRGSGFRTAPNANGDAQISFYLRNDWQDVYRFSARVHLLNGTWGGPVTYAYGEGSFSGPGASQAPWNFETPV